ncbi:MAG: Peptidase M16 domain protein [Candidatus Amesbacteria bacterium GW2011_GWA2_42_12]|uniref:Peptidase M16 domain protein n=1 Tax=Candidatus Amesbacteria bacterium GW2011_GWA2_42_12 TaxID=1618356 RepID=A0A0G0Y6Q1_9BACT|nr:MAG: Peptidase M16 domain protein [Candidatus Amesbacteria bacterium GW2011_GWA2_42_12]
MVRTILVPMSGVKSVAVGVYVGTGSRYESKKENGMSHFLEHLVFKGTEKFKSYKEVNRFIENLGAIQNAGTGTDSTMFYCKIPGDHIDLGLEFISQLVVHPKLRQKDLEDERRVILEEISWVQDRPDELVGDTLNQLMYPGHGLGRDIQGTAETVTGFTADDLREYWKEQYVAPNMVVAVAGDKNKVQDSRVKDQLERLFDGVPNTKGRKFPKFVEKQSQPAVMTKNKSEFKQTNIALGVFGVSTTDPRRFAQSILVTILGRGFSSRLQEEVREERGLCYGIGAYEVKRKDGGMIAVGADLNTEKLPEAITAILREMTKLKEQLVGEGELAAAKEKIRGPLLFGAENPFNQMEFYARQVLEKPHDVLSYDMVIDRLMGVTAEEVRDLACEVFKTEKLNLAVVGPVEDNGDSDLKQLLRI